MEGIKLIVLHVCVLKFYFTWHKMTILISLMFLNDCECEFILFRIVYTFLTGIILLN